MSAACSTKPHYKVLDLTYAGAVMFNEQAGVRYSEDSGGYVYDNLVEYCIDFLCGLHDHSHYFGFALNRVLREYLFNDFKKDSKQETLYRTLHPIPTKYGVVFDHPEGFITGVWADRLHENVSYVITDDEGTVFMTRLEPMSDGGYQTHQTGPIELIGEGLEDLTFVLACLILCRHIAVNRLTQRYKNNHERLVTNAKDSSTI